MESFFYDHAIYKNQIIFVNKEICKIIVKNGKIFVQETRLTGIPNLVWFYEYIISVLQ